MANLRKNVSMALLRMAMLQPKGGPLPALAKPDISIAMVTDTSAVITASSAHATGYLVSLGGESRGRQLSPFTLMGLTAESEYSVTLIAVAEGYANSEPRTCTFTTLETPPPHFILKETTLLTSTTRLY